MRIIPPHTEGTPSGAGSANATKNHPSAYGGYEHPRSGLCAPHRIIPPHTEGTPVSVVLVLPEIESSLRIRRVQEPFTPAAPLERIIPPHTEGTSLHVCNFAADQNHPSAYGGYMGGIARYLQRPESSLRIRRVLYFMSGLSLSVRIIPPHTEGTLPDHTTRQA